MAEKFISKFKRITSQCKHFIYTRTQIIAPPYIAFLGFSLFTIAASSLLKPLWVYLSHKGQ